MNDICLESAARRQNALENQEKIVNVFFCARAMFIQLFQSIKA
jgi:hypothetical protein